MSNSILKEFIKTYKHAKKEYLSKLLISFFLRGTMLVIPVLYSVAINHITGKEYDAAVLMFILAIFVTALYRYLECVNNYFYYKLYNALSTYYTDLAVTNTYNNSMYSLSRFDIGIYTNTMISDIDIISTFMGSLIYRVIQAFELIIIFIFFYTLNIYIFISTLLLTIIMITISLISGKKIEILNHARKESLDKAINSFTEFFVGIREIKSFNLFNNMFPNVSHKANSYLVSNTRYNNKYQTHYQILLYAFELFKFIIMIYGVSLIRINAISIGILLVIYNYYDKIIEDFNTLLTTTLEKNNLKVSMNRLQRLTEFSKSQDDREYLSIDKIKGNIKFENVLYGDRNKPTLDNVSFNISAHSITVLTGMTNNGKSGVFELLLKLNRQHEGKITIDEYDINDINDDSYFQLVSSARKQGNLFKSSIKNNLSVIKDDEERIIDVCDSIGAHDLIMKLSDGYDTIVNDDNIGDNLKLLLSIARVLIRNSSIMLFDDAISGLDYQYQKKVINILTKLKSNHTIIIISHNNKIFNIADRIMVFENHQVAEIGTLSQLIRKNGLFSLLYGKSIRKKVLQKK